jgi:hypothetical protein
MNEGKTMHIPESCHGIHARTEMIFKEKKKIKQIIQFLKIGFRSTRLSASYTVF